MKPSTQDAVLSWQVDALMVQEAKADAQALCGLKKGARCRGWPLAPGKPLQRTQAVQEDGRTRSVIPCGGAISLSRAHAQAEPFEQLSEDEVLLWDSKRFSSQFHFLLVRGIKY